MMRCLRPFSSRHSVPSAASTHLGVGGIDPRASSWRASGGPCYANSLKSRHHRDVVLADHLGMDRSDLLMRLRSGRLQPVVDGGARMCLRPVIALPFRLIAQGVAVSPSMVCPVTLESELIAER